MKALTGHEREYVEDYIKKAWDGFSKSRNRYFYSDRQNIASIRQYMNASIDPVRYHKIVVPPELANEDTSYANINWAPLDIYSKYRRIAVDLVMAMKEMLTIEVLDSMAVEEKEEMFGDLMAQIHLRDELIKRGVDPEDVGIAMDLPENQKELEMYAEYSWKPIAAIEFETILKLIKDRNKYDEKTYRRLVEDTHDIGICISRDEEEIDGNIIAEYVDPEYFFSSYVADNDFSDIEFAGQVKKYTLAECERLTDDPSEIEGFREVERLMDKTDPNHSLRQEERDRFLEHQNLESGYLNVIYCEFISGETETYEIRVTKDGRKVFGRESGGKKNKEFMDAEYDVVYRGYYLLGTDVFFGVQRKSNVLRDPDDVKIGKLSYNIHAPEMNAMSLNSVGKQAIPSIDAINIAWYKLQNAVLNARPSGVAYDLTSLEAVAFGPSGMSTSDNLLTYNTKGNLAVRMVDEDGKIQKMPIQELAGGMGQEGNDFMSQIAFNENLFRSITGLNDLVDGSSPNPKTLKSVAQQAAAATNNALKFMHNNVQMNEMQLSENIVQRVQDQAEGQEIEFYGPAIGSNSVKFFKITKDHSLRSVGLKFLPKPTVEEEERFARALEIALSSPKGGEAQITVAQAAQLEQISNKKYALMYLGYIVEKNIEDAREQQMAIMKQQEESNIRTAQATAQATKEAAAAELEADKEKINLEYGWKRQIAIIEANAKIQDGQNNAEARDRESMRMNQTKESIFSQQRQEKREEKEEVASKKKEESK